VRTLLVAVALLLGCCLAVTRVARAGSGATRVSSNWSGYVATTPADAPRLAFTDATGSWTVKRVFCGGRGGMSAAFWVGIGGASPRSTALEQIGTAADCSPSGAAVYRAWIEIIPGPARYLSLTIRPGDHLTAAVSIDHHTVTFSLRNATRRERYSTRIKDVHPLDTTSAEWIAEAPSLCLAQTVCTIMPLANFGSLRFSHLAMIASRHPGTLADPAWAVSPVVLAGKPTGLTRRLVGATPGATDTAGRSFTVAYRPRLTLPAQPSPHADTPLPPWVH